MRNATNRPADFVPWAVCEAERSPRFQKGIDRLRELAAGTSRAGYPRTTGPLTGKKWDWLERILVRQSGLTQHERPYAWKNTEFPTDRGLRHVADYLRGCQRMGREFLGHEDTAPFIHQLVGATGYRVSVPATISAPAPAGPVASQLAAHIGGASWGAGATAQWQAWRRARPHTVTFVL